MPTVENKSLPSVIETIVPDAVAVRHHLHQYPELSDHEAQTAAFVAHKLHTYGIDTMREGVGGHGIVAELRGASDGPVFAIRADMDALPIEEANEVPYKSQRPGVMHACGHDGHTAVLLGTAAALRELREQIHGTVRFIFQPAEEVAGGAAQMCDEGAMENVAAIVALHGWPGMPVGTIGVRSGAMMASADTFEIVIRGRGAHAAMPHLSIDPVVIAAQVVLALQTIASREIAPMEPVVVSVTQIHTGTAYNVIPGDAAIRGTVRCLDNALREDLKARVLRVAQGIAAANRAEVDFTYRYGTKATINNVQINALVAEVGLETLGAANVEDLAHPSMGAEDFAQYLDYAPGAMFRLGVGEHVTPLHTPTYDFADTAIPHGIAMFTNLALRYLAPRG